MHLLMAGATYWKGHNMRAILVELVLGTDAKPAHMVAYCMGLRTIERPITVLPETQPAHAIALALCHENGLSTDLAPGLLPDGNEVFCFRIINRS